MTIAERHDIMAIRKDCKAKLELEFDRETGYIYATDGVCRRILARLNEHGELLIWWRTKQEQGERRIVIEEIIKAIRK